MCPPGRQPVSRSRGAVRRPAGSRRFSGFTLVELVLVLAILAAATAVAAPRYSGSLARARLSAAAAQVEARLNFARQAAVATSGEVSVSLDVSADRLTLDGLPAAFGTGPNARAASGPLELWSEPFGVDLVAAGFGGSSVVTFDAWGRPSAGGTIEIGIGASRASVTVEAGTGVARRLP